MLTSKIVCPHCQAVLKSSKALRVGKQVTCIQCRQPFAVAAVEPGGEPMPFNLPNTEADSDYDLSAASHDCPKPAMGILEPVKVKPAKESKENSEILVAAPFLPPPVSARFVEDLTPPAPPSQGGEVPARLDGEEPPLVGDELRQEEAGPKFADPTDQAKPVQFEPPTEPAQVDYHPDPVSLPAPVFLADLPRPRKSQAVKWLLLSLAGLLFLGGGFVYSLVFSPREETVDPDQVARALDQQAKLWLKGKKDEPKKIAVPAGPQPAAPPVSIPKQNDAKPTPVLAKEPEKRPEPPAPALPVKPVPVKVAIPPPLVLEPWIGNVPSLTQKRINEAIDKGGLFLKNQQTGNGSWGNRYAVGYAALPGLTLLECGVSPTDPVIQKAATFIRTNVSNLTHTYELSLAILFLDRLGDPRDKAIIKVMAMRLVAGQTMAGGWDYNVPILNANENEKLLTFLQLTRPKKPWQDPLEKLKDLNLPKPLKPKDLNLSDPLKGKDPNLADPLGKTKEDNLPKPLAKPDPKRKGAENPARKSPEDPARKGPPDGERKPDQPGAGIGVVKPGADPSKPGDTPAVTPPAPPKITPKPVIPRSESLPRSLQNIPAVQFKGKGKANLQAGRDDNSNSQFAMLALWAARRHDVPSERTLLLAHQRYVESQSPNGGWGYLVMNRNNPTPAMTCVGLLGLAMGHGSAPELPMALANAGKAKVPPLARNAAEDPIIQKGLLALGATIGTPLAGDRAPPMVNLYYLWSVERVAMIYNLKTIGGRDWYAWGAQMLLANQAGDGSWHAGGYHGSSQILDTCFALLFLKRSNLAQDLTQELQFRMAITDPDYRK